MTNPSQSQRRKEQQVARRLRAKVRLNARRYQVKARHEAPFTRSSARRAASSAYRKTRQLKVGRMLNTAMAHIESEHPVIQAAERVAPQTKNPQLDHATVATMLPQVTNSWTPSLDPSPEQAKLALIKGITDPDTDWKVEVALKHRLCRDHDDEVLIGFCDTATDAPSRGHEFLRRVEKLRLVEQGELPIPNPHASSWHADCTSRGQDQVYAVQKIREDGKTQFRIRWKLMWIPRINLNCEDWWLQQQLEQSESKFRRSERLESGHQDRMKKMRTINEVLRKIE